MAPFQWLQEEVVSWQMNSLQCSNLLDKVLQALTLYLSSTSPPPLLHTSPHALHSFTHCCLSSIAFADLGLVFMIVGTGEYIYHSYKFRHRLHISTTRMVWVVGYALTLLMAWAYGASYIQGEFGLFSHLAIFKSRISQYYYLESKSETERKIGRFNAMKKD